MNELEHMIDPDCWTVSRQFRAFLGTSPNCFRNLRKFDQTYCHLKQSMSLAADALGAQPVTKALVLLSAKGESDKHMLQASARQDVRKQTMRQFPI